MSTEAKTLLSFRQAILIFVIKQDTSRVNSYSFTISDIIDCSFDVFLFNTKRTSNIIVLASRYKTHGDALLIRTCEHPVDHMIEGHISSNSYQSTIGLYVLQFIGFVEWTQI